MKNLMNFSDQQLSKNEMSKVNGGLKDDPKKPCPLCFPPLDGEPRDECGCPIWP